MPEGLKVINQPRTDSVIKIMRKHTPTIDEPALSRALPDEGYIFVKSSFAPGHYSAQPAALRDATSESLSVGDSAENARLDNPLVTMCPAVAKPGEWQT